MQQRNFCGTVIKVHVDRDEKLESLAYIMVMIN